MKDLYSPFTKQGDLGSHICLLENGETAHYDAAHSTGEQVYNPEHFKFIGKGVIYSIQGVLQNSDDMCWFYIRK